MAVPCKFHLPIASPPGVKPYGHCKRGHLGGQPLEEDCLTKCLPYLCDGQIAPVSPKHWPIWAVGVSLRRKPGEVGVGETARKVFDAVGGEKFKAWAEWLGIPCGCLERERDWNAMFRYADLNAGQ